MKIKKVRPILCIMFLMLVMSFGNSVNAQEVSEVASGKCGEDIVWSLDEEGTLTLSGKGSMSTYSFFTSPWYSRRDEIKTIEIEDGITCICFL